MELKKNQLIFVGLGIAIIAVAYFTLGPRLFPLAAGFGALIAASPFVLGMIKDIRIASEKEEMFLEFARNLVESVKTGTPISKSITNTKDKDYGVLSAHIGKLANQINLGIPLINALEIFAKDVRNKSISRALTLIGQAERAGGEIGEILEAVAEAVSMTDKLKKERKASISTLVVQGYIIFLIFILIILVMQFQIIPMVSGIADSGTDLGGSSAGGVSGFGIGLTGGVTGGEVTQDEISNSFLYLILVQGFFTGLTIGKLSEGSLKAGVKHSFSLMFLSFLISAAANVLLG
ncbi:MAG: type II secretion system F family protein [Nanoarchaeota archaeon]|nr:type II secretion system F family protein [Nanoarchaeota archaeon]